MKSKKGMTLAEIMMSIIIASIVLVGTLSFFVKMHKMRYFNFAQIYYLDMAISTLEYRKCYGTGNPIEFPIGVEQLFGGNGEYMPWCVNQDLHSVGAFTSFGSGAGTQTYRLIRTEFVGGYPFLKPEMTANNSYLKMLFDYNTSQIEFTPTSVPSNSVRTYIMNAAGEDAGKKTIRLVTYYLNDAYEWRG